MLLLRGEELGLGEGLPQGLLGHERLQFQQSRDSAVLANETGAIGIKVDCGRKGIQQKENEGKTPLNTGGAVEVRIPVSAKRCDVLTQFKDLEGQGEEAGARRVRVVLTGSGAHFI